MKKSKRENVIIQVVNKISTGGVERITQDLHAELRGRDIQSTIFELAPNEISQKFLSRKVLRLSVFLIAFTRLVLRIAHLDLIKKKNCIVIFNHAECHLLGSYFPLPSFLAPHSLGVMSLFQSPQLYPQRILTKVMPCFEKVPRNLCYSSNVAEGWEKITNARLFNLPLGVRIQTDRKIEHPPESKISGDAVKILHIGRDTPWKRPRYAAIFAQEVAALGIKVELHYIGITKNDELSMYEQDPNLKIHFHGLLRSIDSELLASDIIVNLFDCSLSLESIGLGALEALAIGKLVVIEKMSDTSFKNLYGVYEKDQMLKILTNNVQLGRSPLDNISVTDVEHKTNLVEISISTYASRLLALIDKFGKSSEVKSN